MTWDGSVTGIRATYCRVPLVTVTWTVPRGIVTFTSRNSRLKIVRTQKPAIAATMGWPLAGRSVIVALFLAPLACAMGMCFPVGMRLVGRHSDRITAWMWGVNGACGVLASILAVMSSMWLGIDASLWVAAALYALLALPMRRLARA